MLKIRRPKQLLKLLREIDNLRNQLKTANEKAAVPPAASNNAQAQAAIEAAKKEIDNLRNQLKASDQKVSAAEKRAADAEKKHLKRQRVLRLMQTLLQSWQRLSRKLQELRQS